jgi:uncharacterized protein YcbX
MIELRAITIYPVKSCRGIAIDRARVLKRGLEHDRRWMITDGDGRFVTQREEPRLSLIDSAIDDKTITLGANGSSVVFPIAIDDGPRIDVEIWSRRVVAIEHVIASEWASDYLRRRVRMVHLPETTPSAVISRYARDGDEVGFADGFPLLAATEESLADLGARIEARGGKRVPMHRFRPNVVVRGAPAWDEDGWTSIAIGETTLRAPKACDRCVVTTIDPATARAGPEPLRTLATFRRRDNAVWFAINLVPDTLGTIAVGDEVRVIDRVTPPTFD